MHQGQENVLEALCMQLDLLLDGACGAFSFSSNICLFFLKTLFLLVPFFSSFLSIIEIVFENCNSTDGSVWL